MTGEERVRYYRAIFAACERRPTHVDYDIVMRWAGWDPKTHEFSEEPIPLAWVLQALKQMEHPKSVAYAKAAVEEEVQRCRRSVPV